MSLTPSNTISHRPPLWLSTPRSNRAGPDGPRPPNTPLPPIPMLITATPAVGALVLRRSAILSGQRVFPSVVEPRPSVIESPRVTTALLEASARTSTPEMIYQCAVFAAPGKLAAETALPGAAKKAHWYII